MSRQLHWIYLTGEAGCEGSLTPGGERAYHVLRVEGEVREYWRAYHEQSGEMIAETLTQRESIDACEKHAKHAKGIL